MRSLQASWRRQTHAGIAYDSKRGTLLVFGSNTHGLDWDNEVHEFDPVTGRWETHYPRAPKESYRADAAGRTIAGTGRLMPGAMHTLRQHRLRSEARRHRCQWRVFRS